MAMTPPPRHLGLALLLVLVIGWLIARLLFQSTEDLKEPVDLSRVEHRHSRAPDDSAKLESSRSDSRLVDAPIREAEAEESRLWIRFLDGHNGAPIHGVVLWSDGALCSSDESGLAAIPRSHEGPARLHAIHEHYLPLRLPEEALASPEDAPYVIHMDAGESLEGTILDDLGRPLEGALVDLSKGTPRGTRGEQVESFAVASLAMDGAELTYRRVARSDSRGAFRIRGLLRGEHLLELTKPGYVQDPAVRAVAIEVGDAAPADYVLSRIFVAAARIDVRCPHVGHHSKADFQAMMGCPKAMVSLGPLLGAIAQRDIDQVRSIASLPPALSMVSLFAPAKSAAVEEAAFSSQMTVYGTWGSPIIAHVLLVPLVSFRAEDVTTVSLFETCPGHGALRVRTALGVDVFKQLGGILESRVQHSTREDGLQVFDLAAGSYRVNATSSALVPKERSSRTVSIEPGMTAELDFREIEASFSWLTLRVLDRAGNETDAYNLNVVTSSGHTVGVRGSFFGGNFRLACLPGNHSIELFDLGGSSLGTSKVEVAESAEKVVVLRMKEG